MHRRLVPVLAATALVLSACGGGSDSGSVTDDDGGTADEPATDEPATDEPIAANEPAADENIADDLPRFLSDFDQVCTLQSGFAGATPYDASTPGPHPFVMMVEVDSGNIFERDLNDAPAGWNIQTDGDFDDNSEIVPTELIGCAIRGATEPTGIMCDLEDDDTGDITTLEIVNVTYELSVREATTGSEVGTETIEANESECPFFVFVEEGDTQYFNDPTQDQLLDAMRPYVMP